MKLKKLLLILLATISCICLGALLGCKDEPVTVEEYAVNFELSEHVKYVIDGEEVEERQLKVNKETTVNFSVVVEEGFLAETLVIKANGTTLPASDGVYSHYVTEDTTITATVAEDLLDIDDDGAYLVSSLKDLRFVADMVNSGYPDYVTGSYKLLNDIDCGGTRLDVIGHFEHQTAFFAGVFDGQNHTISNYTISTNGQTYVGFFGCVQISTSSTTVIIQNLNLKDFTINATASDDNSVCVGGIAAFTAGANVVACSAEGVINAYGSGYFSYVGGAVGIQQSLTVTAADNLLYHYHASTEYVHTKVSIAADNGYILSAGGVVGQAISSHERAASMIMNSYAEGNVFGAMRSGGVVGTLGDYSSVANCYATGFVSSTVTFPEKVTNSDYFAYAGGIAAYAGIETTISDSFTKCTLHAESKNTENATGDFYAYASPKTEFVNTATVFNCYAGNDVQPTNANFIKNTLKWNDADWVIKDGAYPTTNFNQSTIDFKITLDYLNNSVKVNIGNDKFETQETKDIFVNITDNSYFPFSSYLGDTIDEFIVAAEEGYTSYGFFFDEKCTQKVHYSFVPTRDITLYVGFANYAKIAGTYEFAEGGRTVKLILNTDATYSYVDVRSFGGSYVYDGTNLTFSEALFARLSSNVLVDEYNNPQPWLNYEPYKFVGTVNDDKLLVYDGNYFTKETVEGKNNRLVFTKEGEKPETNNFIGTWERSATINEKYTFKSDLTWSYKWKDTELSGNYSINKGVATLTDSDGNTEIATASIDNSGLLLIQEKDKAGKYFCLENSFFGNWYSSKDGAYLVLDGCGTDNAGSANAIISGTVYDSLAYVKDGFFDNLTSNNPYTYTIISGYSLFGYFTYDAKARTITAMLYDQSLADFIEFNFVLYDYYLGEWIGEDAVGDVGKDQPFTIIDFNGLGLYKAEGDTTLGYVIINGTKVPYDCSVENGLDGKFNYNGNDYVLTTNGDGTVTISLGESSVNLMRKDEMASTPLVDRVNNVYKFNGGGHLSKGGVLTVAYSNDRANGDKRGKEEEYVYKIESGSIEGYLDEEGEIAGFDILINLYANSVEGDVIGTITISYPKFVLELNGKEENLDLYFEFAGKQWSISGLMNSFNIGKFDLTYEAIGSYNGTNNVPFLYYPEYNYIYVYFRVDGEGFNSYYVRNYLLILDDGNMIVSSYPYFVSSDQWYYASPSDELVGSWDNTVTGAVLKFDGLADSKYAVGVAWDATNGITYLYTRRFGTIYMWREEDDKVVEAYTVTYEYDDELTGENVYLLEGGTRFDRIVLEADDIIVKPIKEAVYKGTKYEFNFDGTVKVGDKSGTYLINSVDGDTTTVEITVDGKKTTVVVNHNDDTLKVID